MRGILGDPLQQFQFSETGVTRVRAGETLWEYASPKFAGSGFAASVAFRDGRVFGAEIKHDDLGLYLCTEGLCPQWFGAAGRLHKLRKQ